MPDRPAGMDRKTTGTDRKTTGTDPHAAGTKANTARNRAVRLSVAPPDTDIRASVRESAQALGVLGWIRAVGDDKLEIHAEGPSQAVESLLASLPDSAVEVTEVRREGHEQFAIRGVSAGVFVVQEHAATAHHFDLRLEVEGMMRSWAVPKGPSLDPAAKRLAVQVEDHEVGHNEFEGPTERGGVIVWDRGTYEQGGRVPWPEAIERGHAVFVLRGEKLRGGFALQRTRAGSKPQWLLVKRRDEEARPGSDIVAERPVSVLSGRTLDQVRSEASAPGAQP